ncbi:hypothetical protein SAMN04488030_2384 [Aliiroseovarius halocynthiae]|uniref:Uncharacterized protein n=1 Tax=Aliiroseovarius halocynthiae TaxID=985055 RepID=A0A545SZD6_9RHOB|nr:hypothetical protein [Aliiroseovarius halocynthiae]TQV70333.1 hypothetical protein FIL88_00030 [Aliiroseovarius halocynthiae]SMR81994.1 hypothetical protein SAMN04488030_2384 [Aliiroseovarius halocynthiae]
MQRDVIAPTLIGVLAVAAIAAGLMFTGGPNTARAEKRDDARHRDIRDLSRLVSCIKSHDDALPDTLKSDERCKAAPLVDQTNRQPYRYNVISENSFDLCADFELPERFQSYSRYTRPSGQWQKESECFRFTLK